jgi:hypothetical protein
MARIGDWFIDIDSTEFCQVVWTGGRLSPMLCHLPATPVERPLTYRQPVQIRSPEPPFARPDPEPLPRFSRPANYA